MQASYSCQEFLPEIQQRTEEALLLVNLGTPSAPEERAVYRYLTEFLTDSRVIDLPYLRRQLLVRGYVVPMRYRSSTASYRAIWTEEGSPLLVYSRRLQEKLQERLGSQFSVELAMRYQEPSMEQLLDQLEKKALGRLTVLPLFPQYASATSGSVLQKAMEQIARWPIIPQLRCIDSFATFPPFLDAFAAQGRGIDLDRYDKILFSFHGLPQEQLKKVDRSGYCLSDLACCSSFGSHNRFCYGAQCYATAHGVAERLGLQRERYQICFQSRLGRSAWLQPYATDVIGQLAKAGAKRLLLFSPSFVVDCLETLFEIGEEGEALFRAQGGEELHLVPSLNDEAAWVEALAALVTDAGR